MNKTYIGIDVGKKGGIVTIYPDGKVKTEKTPLVANEIDTNTIRKILQEIVKAGNTPIIGIENVTTIMGSGASSNFQFGRALGLIEGLVAGMGLPFVKVHAKTWQKLCFEGISVVTKAGKPKFNKKTGFTENTLKTDTKAMALLACMRLYPYVSLLATDRSKVPHDGIVDSLCIAHYLKSTNK